MAVPVVVARGSALVWAKSANIAATERAENFIVLVIRSEVSFQWLYC